MLEFILFRVVSGFEAIVGLIWNEALQENEDAAPGYVLLTQNSKDEGRPLFPIPLGGDKGGGQHDPCDKRSDYGSRPPSLLDSSPFEREDVAHERSEADADTGQIHLQQLFSGGSRNRLGRRRSVEQDQKENQGGCSDGKIDVKAPPPRYLFSEDAAEKRTSDASTAENGPNPSDKGGDTRRLDNVCDDGIAAACDASAAQALDGAANDEGGAVGREGAEQAPNFEDGHRGEERSFQREILVCLAPGGLEHGEGDEEGGSVPSHLLQTMEILRDARNGCGHDGHVQGHEEHAQQQGGEDGVELESHEVLARRRRKLLGILLVVLLAAGSERVVLGDAIGLVDDCGFVFGRHEGKLCTAEGVARGRRVDCR